MNLIDGKIRLSKNWQRYNVITSEKLLEAFLSIPRENFIRKNQISSAYGDYPLSIGYGQTISQPTTVMIMLQLLDLKEDSFVLEIGGGSGYSAAIMSKICSRVITIERIPGLADFAKENILKLKIKNVEVLCNDGKKGYQKEAPYDRIIVAAASEEVPKSLLSQLKVNGILVMPLGPVSCCDMVKIVNHSNGEYSVTKHGKFSFVPLV